jgi:GTP cyclohydrolase II
VYQDPDDHWEAVALSYGRISAGRDLPVRIQSVCVYGDTLGISDCDCGQQLEDTYGRFLEARRGLLVFVRGEGYGHGLGVQARALHIGNEFAIDPIQAYFSVGVQPNLKNYETAVEVLTDLGINSCVLLTNNQSKITQLQAAGIDVVREAVPVRPTADNIRFLVAKQTLLDQPLGLKEDNDQEAQYPHCFVIGTAVMDHVFEVRHNPSIGRTRQAERYRRRPGGKAFNQAVALARLGASSSLLTVRGNDPDAREISNVLATERVHGFYTGRPDGLRTPQTVVVQPPGRSPTYVGWLGEQHRLLHPNIIGQHKAEIEAADAVLLTLEASESTVHRAVRMARANSLVVLNASPIVEPPYELGTDTLEHVDILIGSREELAALVRQRRPSGRPEMANGLEIARTLASLCNITVVVTEFRAVHRWALAVNSLIEMPLRVFAGNVRRDVVSDAIGTSDVFCAALAIHALSLPGADQLPRVTGIWRGRRSPLARREHLVDVLMAALGAEAYVARSRGGYKEFPHAGPEFEHWCRQHPPRVEAPEATLRNMAPDPIDPPS